jgi:hypothetical protein
MDVEDWLTDTERKLKTVGCSEEEKVRYATYLLTGPATSWWENNIAIHPTTHVFSWEVFKEKFREHHVPESIMELKRQEFENLEQGSAPVMKYIRDFSRLSRYAVDEVSTEEKRKKRFLRGLNPYVKIQMRPSSTQGFQKLVDAAITFKDDYRQVQEERKKRARLEPKQFQPKKSVPNLSFKPKFRPGGNTSNPSPLNPRSKLICHNCGQPGHVKSECMKPKIVCYGCNQEGHIKTNCPTNPLEVGQQLEEGISVGTIVESEEGHLGS